MHQTLDSSLFDPSVQIGFYTIILLFMIKFRAPRHYSQYCQKRGIDMNVFVIVAKYVLSVDRTS